MKKYIKINLIIIALFTSSYVNAQQTLAILNENIYSSNYNPGKPSVYKWHVGFPGVSNLTLTFSENLLTYKKFVTSTDTSIIINPTNLLKNLKRPTRFTVDVNEEILGFGFKTDENSYFTFSTRLRSESYFMLPNELLSMLIKGNAEYIGKNIESNISAYHSSYLEASITYQYTIQNKYTIGFRPKFLIGLTNVHTEQSKINFLTTEDWDIQTNGVVQMNTYLPFNEEFEPKTDDFINGLLKNPGFAIDIGAHFELPADFGIAFSINDLGTILWSNDRLTNSFSFTTNDTGKFIKEGSIFFDGFEVSLKGIQDGQMPDINTVLDSISADDFITYSYARRDVYRTPLYPKLYLEFFYKLSNYRFTILSRTDFVGKHPIPSVTFACNGYFGNIVELALSYSIYNRTFNNLGFGAHFHFGPVQLYFAFDNLIGPIAPKYFNSFSVQTGLYFGIRPKKNKIAKSSYL